MSSKDYLLLNNIFAALLFCLFCASYFIDADSMISCQIMEHTGKECKSCGLTRDFKAFSHFNFKTPINSNSIFVFSWFVLQFIMRIILIQISPNLREKALKYDIAISILTGILVFLPFWI